MHKLTCGQRERERELATLDEKKSTSSGIADDVYAR